MDTSTYSDMTVDELKAELRSRDLKVSGRKDELVTRLAEADAMAGVPMPEGFEQVEKVRSAEIDLDPTPPQPDPEIAAMAVEVELEDEVVESAEIAASTEAPSEMDVLVDELRNTVAQLRTLLEATAHTVEAQTAALAKMVKKATTNATKATRDSEAARTAADAAAKAQSIAENAACSASNQAKGAMNLVSKTTGKLKKKKKKK
jgi:hypothetical protein